ncbi:hypothetical protein [Serratia sp. Tan611]|uniref:hypothetical protein n=1 Tax=Serratia sp. Tan611 TaxID=2773264 RepID=UPI0019349540|nr:hypothetical protein [Serratia sp. Tan611]CAE1145500.1 conserved protein of unknown function [Serratia sp. Tan611]
MAFLKAHEIAGLTVSPTGELNVDANFLTPEVMREAQIIVGSMTPDQVSKLTKVSESQIAFTLNDYRDKINKLQNTDRERGGTRPGGTISHIDNRISLPMMPPNWGIKAQYLDNVSKVAGGGATLVAAGAMLFSLGAGGAGSILGRSLLTAGTGGATGWVTHFVTKKIQSVNQIAGYLKSLAEMYNTTHNSLLEFNKEIRRKKIAYARDNSANAQSFEDKVMQDNDIYTPAEKAEMDTLMRAFVGNDYQSVKITGDSVRFIEFRFVRGDSLTVSKTAYSHLADLKFS